MLLARRKRVRDLVELRWSDWRRSCLAWRFGESRGTRKIDEPIANGCLIDLHSFELPMPSVTSPEKVRFDVELLDAEGEVRCRNHWYLWVFPRVEMSLPGGFDDVVDAALLERVANGERLLVSGNGLRRLSMSFQSSTAAHDGEFGDGDLGSSDAWRFPPRGVLLVAVQGYVEWRERR